MWRAILLALCIASAAWTPVALAQQPVRVRVGDHPGHGRIVFDWPSPPAYRSEQVGDQVVLRFPEAAVDLSGARRLPRNVAGLAHGAEGIEITLRPGARVRHFLLGPMVVVDLLDPVAESVTEPAMRPADVAPVLAATPPASLPGEAASVARRNATPRLRPAGPVPALPAIGGAPAAAMLLVGGGLAALATTAVPVEPAGLPLGQPAHAATVPPRPHLPVSAPAGSAPAGLGVVGVPAPAATAPGPLPRSVAGALVVRVMNLPGRGPALALPFPAGTGAALLRRGGSLLAVFDSALPLDLAALRGDPAFGAVTALPLPGGTALHLPIAASATLVARLAGSVWLLEAIGPAAMTPVPVRAMAIEADAGSMSRLVLRAVQPGRVVTLADPESGLPLLLGTVREAGQAMPVGRRLPELDLPATLLGAAVLARADSVTMQAGLDRFMIGAAGGARLALDATAAHASDAAAMTRLFDLPALPTARLLEQLRARLGGIAAAAPLARLTQRRGAAETLLALGLPQEAQAMLGLSLLEDPTAAADLPFAALGAAAALLAGRLPEAAALQDPGLAGTDELTLWRAVLTTAHGEARAAAPGLAATLPLLLDYPEGLRARLLPLAALALAESGDAAALGLLLRRAMPEFDSALARAVLAEAEGRVEDALAGYAVAARSRDRQMRAGALRRDVELRLASGRMTAPQAARALDAALFAWRGDATGFTARVRVAELWRLAGDAPAALALLRESEALFPDQAAALRPLMQSAFVAALEGHAPLAAVALFDAYPELLRGDARGEPAAVTLADRLVALDLTDRAAVLLRQTMERASGEARAMLGLRLAALRLAEGDAPGTLAALEASAATGLAEAVAQDRAILAARAEARRGHLPQAVTALRALGTAALEPLAELLAEAQDWAAAAAALGAHIEAALPPSPAPLDQAQHRLLVRQAAMLALAGDDTALAALRTAHADRLRDGALHGAFTLLTGDPLRGLGDLPRLQRELQLFRGLPVRLEALRAGGPVTRYVECGHGKRRQNFRPMGRIHLRHSANCPICALH